jgi:hypothetical protein
VDAFFNTIRWDTEEAMQGEEFKMNNDFRPYYARLWLQNNPDHWDFFEVRRVKGEEPPPPAHQPPSYDPDGHGLLF